MAGSVPATPPLAAARACAGAGAEAGAVVAALSFDFQRTSWQLATQKATAASSVRTMRTGCGVESSDGAKRAEVSRRAAGQLPGWEGGNDAWCGVRGAGCLGRGRGSYHLRDREQREGEVDEGAHHPRRDDDHDALRSAASEASEAVEAGGVLGLDLLGQGWEWGPG